MQSNGNNDADTETTAETAMVVPELLRNRALLLFGLALTAVASFLLLDRFLTSELLTLGAGCAVAAAGVYLAIAKQQAVYMLLIAALPLEATFVVEAGFSITPYYVLFGLLIVSYVIHGKHVSLAETPSRLLITYFVICTVSLVVGLSTAPPEVHASSAMAWRASAMRPLIQWILTAVHILFFVVVLNRIRSRDDILSSVKLYLWIGLGLGLIGCWQTLAVALDLPGKDFTHAFGAAADQGYQYGKTRFYSAFIADFAPRATFRESLHLSHYLVSFLPLAIGIVLYRKQLPESWRIRTTLILVVISLATLLLTMSRSGWIAFAGAMAFMFCFCSKARMFKAAAATIAVIAVAGLALKSLGYFRFDLDIWELMQLRMDVEKLGADPRVLYMQTLWATFVQYPLLGVGIGNYGLFGAARLGMDVVLSAHSVFLNALVETGIIGFAVLCSVIVHFFWSAIGTIRKSRTLAAFPMLVGVCAGVFGMTIQYCTFGDRPGFHYLFMIALGYAMIRFIRQNPLPSTVN